MATRRLYPTGSVADQTLRGHQINNVIAEQSLIRATNQFFPTFYSNKKQARDLSGQLLSKKRVKLGGKIWVSTPNFTTSTELWDHTSISGTNQLTVQKNFTMSVQLNQHVSTNMEESVVARATFLEASDWSMTAMEEIAERVNEKWLDMIATAGGTGATCTNEHGTLNHQTFQWVKGKIKANGAKGVEGNLCCAIPEDLVYLLSGDVARAIQRYPSNDVKAQVMDGKLQKSGGVDLIKTTQLAAHTCGDYRGTLTLAADVEFSVDNDENPSDGIDGNNEGNNANDNDSFNVQNMRVQIHGFTAGGNAQSSRVVFRKGDQFVVHRNFGDSAQPNTGGYEVNLSSGRRTKNLQVFTVQSDVTLTGAVTGTTVATAVVSPGLFYTKDKASGFMQGLSEQLKSGWRVYMQGRPGITYDQVVVYNKMDALFLPVKIPHIPNIKHSVATDKNSGLTIAIATDGDAKKYEAFTRWDVWWGMQYWAYGNNSKCNIRVLPSDGLADGARAGAVATGALQTGAALYSNVHAAGSGGLAPTTVAPIQADVRTISVD